MGYLGILLVKIVVSWVAALLRAILLLIQKRYNCKKYSFCSFGLMKKRGDLYVLGNTYYVVNGGK